MLRMATVPSTVVLIVPKTMVELVMMVAVSNKERVPLHQEESHSLLLGETLEPTESHLAQRKVIRTKLPATKTNLPQG